MKSLKLKPKSIYREYKHIKTIRLLNENITHESKNAYKQCQVRKKWSNLR